LEFQPNVVVIGKEDLYQTVFDALDSHGIKVYAGDKALEQVVQMDSIDLVLAAIVGYAGLRSTLSAVQAGKRIALANKESLVVAGHLVIPMATEKQIGLIPVDSEHSAIFQCLAGELHNPIEKIILTASGGPFRGRTNLDDITPEEALKHPNWDMGAKITIDSASLMNKGLEVIEACWLFDIKPEQIEVVVHPESIVHSVVQFEDGSLKAQMGLPDMKLPIQYALAYPNRIPSKFERFDFVKQKNLSFESADTKTFRNLALAFEALKLGGNMPCVLNAANEVAVESFLKGQLRFSGMSDVIEHCMNTINSSSNPNYDELVETDVETRKVAMDRILKTA